LNLSEIFSSFLILFLIILILSNVWRYFWQSSEDIWIIRQLEPVYWFLFLNLILSVFTSNFNYSFVPAAVILQVAMSAWFAVSMSWIVKSCHHKMVVAQPVWFGTSIVKYCFRCGTRMARTIHADSPKHTSWVLTVFQIPPHLFEYVVFWVAQSIIILIVFFLTVHILKKPNFQQDAVLAALGLVVIVPMAIYFAGHFKRYLAEAKSQVWWDDLYRSFILWGVILAILIVLAKWF
jgi:hypothetical protein